MRSLLLLLLPILMGGIVWSADGDMGLGTEPLTDGSVDFPWLIEDVIDFDVFASDEFYWASGVHTKLMCDINLSGRTYHSAVIAPDMDSENSFFQGTGFCASFDGNNFLIINLTIDATESRNDYLGLFGQIQTSAIVEQLGIENASVTGWNYRSFNIGSLVGDNERGNIKNCYSTGLISGDSQVGGLVGHNYYGVMMNCYSSASVSGRYSVGGLVGDNQGNLINSYATGSVDGEDNVGGLVGDNSFHSIANCYSTGLVSGISSAGGLVGDSSQGSVTNSFWDVETSEFGSAGDDNYGAVGKTTSQLKMQSTYINADWDFIDETVNGTSQVWQMPQAEGYPVLSHFCGFTPVTLSGSGSPDDPYLIATSSDLGAIYHYGIDVCYKLISDIDLNGINWSTAVIPAFYGDFDGQGHRIINLDIDGSGYLGLWGILGFNAKIKDVGLENATITGTGSSIGGLAGSKYYGEVTKCYSLCDISGSGEIGGLIGMNSGRVIECYSNGFVRGNVRIGGLVGMNYSGELTLTGSYSTCEVSADSYAGGLIGWNYYGCTVTDCYAKGNVTADRHVGGLTGNNYDNSIIKHCYSTGLVTGSGDNIGGLLGSNYGTVVDSYWDVETSGQGNPGDDNFGATGKTTAEMNILNTFSGWDFEDIWVMDGYPDFCWQNKFIGDGSSTNPYLIRNRCDFDIFCSDPNYWGQGVHTKLMSDIDLSGRTYTAALIAADTDGMYPYDGIMFSGIFDGNDFTIDNLRIAQFENEYIGLFGNVSTSGRIERLKLTNMNLEGDKYVGGIAGFNSGSITHCSTEVNIQSDGGYAGGIAGKNNGLVSYSSSSSTIKGCAYLGGLIGWNNGDVDHCDTNGIVRINIDNGSMIGGLVGIQDTGTITDSSSTSNIYGSNWDDAAGGLVGKNYATIERCFATGNLSESDYEVGGLVGYNCGDIIDCFATGDIDGNTVIGGLVGYNTMPGQVINCYASGNVSGEEYVGGLAGFCARGGIIIKCYSKGYVNAGEYAGGLIGFSYNGVFDNCFWDINTSDINNGIGNIESDSSGVTGKNTTEMMTQNTFIMWDFTDSDGDPADWMMLREGQDYPRLAWQEVYAADIAGLYGVDMVDVSYLANYWGLSDCDGLDDCGRADIDGSGDVGLGDLAQVANHWLSGVE